MASHNELGQEAEAMAVTWLIENGFTIMHRNWRYSRYEIDIIAFKKDFLHFIEVKARKSSRFGNPEDSVRKKKFRDLQRAADAFLYRSEEHTSELQSQSNLVCRLLLEK